MRQKKRMTAWMGWMLILMMVLTGCQNATTAGQNPHGMADVLQNTVTMVSSASESIALAEVPEYSGQPYVVVNDNEPDFSEGDMTSESSEYYSDLDSLGRCGTAFANIGTDLMPAEKRGAIGQIKPSGWQTVKYDFVDGKYLYNRCHLIGYQLTAENANEKNLITGTRYLNVTGMLPFENMVADYVKETKQHVLYRVTPVYDGNNLVASGVLMEAQSVEDGGAGIQYCVFVYNVQPGVSIDYATGGSWESTESEAATIGTQDDGGEATGGKSTGGEITDGEGMEQAQQVGNGEYILNTSTKKFHIPTCSSVKQMKASNKESYHGSRESLIDQGYSPCKNCNP